MSLLLELMELATINDIATIEKLVNSAYRGDSSKKGWTTEANLLDGIRIDREEIETIIEDPKKALLLYKIDGQIVGCVNLEKKENSIYLGMLTVNPEKQAAGIGKKLLKEAEEFAIEQNTFEIEMTVISKRKELIAWYVRNGYQQTEEIRPFPMNNPRFGIPKTDLEFIVLKKYLR